MLINEDIQKALNNMFGFIITQPIHQTLKQLCLLQVFLVLSSQYILFNIVDSLNDIPHEYKHTAYVSISLALIGQVFAAVFGLRNKE